MVTYDPGSVSTRPGNSADPDRTPDSANPETAHRFDRPRPGGTLRTTRRAIAVIRVVLIAAAVFCGFRAAATSEVDVEVSDTWTLAMAVAVCLVPAGGLFWWVRHPLPELALRRERGRTLGRRLRAVAATIGLVAFFVLIYFDYQAAGIAGLVLFAVSPLLYALAMAGRPSRAEIRQATATADGDVPPGDARQAALEAVAEHCAVLYEDTEGRHASAATIRPRRPVNTPVPAHLRAWLDNGALSTDGDAVSVTDANGRVHTRPLARGARGDDPDGAATLMVRREVARISTPRGRSAPQYRQCLTLLDTAGRRLLDLDSYGWTRSELVAFARAAGLDLRVYAPAGFTSARSTMRGGSPSPFDLAHPRALGYARAPGRSRVGDALLAMGTVIVVLALATVGWMLAAWVAHWFAQDSPWAHIVATGAMVLVVAIGMMPIVAVFDRVNRKRHAVPGPPDAI